MTRVQRLFDKGYTHSGAGSPRGAKEIGGTRVQLDRIGRASALAGLAAVALTIPILLAGSVAASGPGPVASPWSQYDTGRVSVVFPSAFPSVDLYQDANSSVSASLQVAGVYEIDPTAEGGATVVAGAFPFDLEHFNGTSAGSSSGTPILLSANLPVYPVGVGLFSPGAQIVATGAPTGSTTLTVTFSPTTSTPSVAGVQINWTSSGWALASGDLLALGFSFGYASGASLTACESSTGLFLAHPPCGGSSVSTGSSIWGNQYTSLEGEGGAGGPVAVVTWGSSIDYGTAGTPVTVGAIATAPGSAQFILGSAPTGTAPGHGSVTFALVAPTVTTVSAIVQGNLLAFVGAGVLIAVGVSASIVAARRRDRKAIEEL